MQERKQPWEMISWYNWQYLVILGGWWQGRVWKEYKITWETGWITIAFTKMGITEERLSFGGKKWYQLLGTRFKLPNCK